MKVILKKDVKGTGKAGDVVKVSDGFARNKLIPSGEGYWRLLSRISVPLKKRRL